SCRTAQPLSWYTPKSGEPRPGIRTASRGLWLQWRVGRCQDFKCRRCQCTIQSCGETGQRKSGHATAVPGTPGVGRNDWHAIRPVMSHEHLADECPLCASSDITHFHRDRRRSYRLCARCSLVFVPACDFLSREDEQACYDLHRNDPADLRY